MRISDWSSDVCSSDLIAKASGSVASTAAPPTLSDSTTMLHSSGESIRAPKSRSGQRSRGLASKRGRRGTQPLRDGATRRAARPGKDRKSVVQGKSVSVRVDLGGRRIIKKNKKYRHRKYID